MKKIILILIFSFSSFLAISQVSKYKAYAISVRMNIGDNSWTDWESWMPTNGIFTIDVVNSKIKGIIATAYSNNINNYDIINNYGETHDGNNNDVFSWRCVDDDGKVCIVRLVKLNAEVGTSLIYVELPKWNLCYKTNNLN